MTEGGITGDVSVLPMTGGGGGGGGIPAEPAKGISVRASGDIVAVIFGSATSTTSHFDSSGDVE